MSNKTLLLLCCLALFSAVLPAQSIRPARHGIMVEVGGTSPYAGLKYEKRVLDNGVLSLIVRPGIVYNSIFDPAFPVSPSLGTSLLLGKKNLFMEVYLDGNYNFSNQNDRIYLGAGLGMRAQPKHGRWFFRAGLNALGSIRPTSSAFIVESIPIPMLGFGVNLNPGPQPGGSNSNENALKVRLGVAGGLTSGFNFNSKAKIFRNKQYYDLQSNERVWLPGAGAKVLFAAGRNEKLMFRSSVSLSLSRVGAHAVYDDPFENSYDELLSTQVVAMMLRIGPEFNFNHAFQVFGKSADIFLAPGFEVGYIAVQGPNYAEHFSSAIALETGVRLPVGKNKLSISGDLRCGPVTNSFYDAYFNLNDLTLWIGYEFPLK